MVYTGLWKCGSCSALHQTSHEVSSLDKQDVRQWFCNSCQEDAGPQQFLHTMQHPETEQLRDESYDDVNENWLGRTSSLCHLGVLSVTSHQLLVFFLSKIFWSSKDQIE